MAPRQANHEGEAGLLKGWRIRQIVRLGPLMRLNLSKTGVSLSLAESEPLGRPEDRSPDDRGAQQPAPQDAQAPPARKSLVQALSSWFRRDK